MPFWFVLLCICRNAQRPFQKAEKIREEFFPELIAVGIKKNVTNNKLITGFIPWRLADFCAYLKKHEIKQKYLEMAKYEVAKLKQEKADYSIQAAECYKMLDLETKPTGEIKSLPEA